MSEEYSRIDDDAFVPEIKGTRINVLKVVNLFKSTDVENAKSIAIDSWKLSEDDIIQALAYYNDNEEFVDFKHYERAKLLESELKESGSEWIDKEEQNNDSDEGAYTPEETPKCPHCNQEDTIQVRPDRAGCFNEVCDYDRFGLVSCPNCEELVAEDRVDAPTKYPCVNSDCDVHILNSEPSDSLSDYDPILQACNYIEKSADGEYYIKNTRIQVSSVAACLDDETCLEDLADAWNEPVEAIREAKQVHDALNCGDTE